MQFQSHLLGVPVVRPKVTETTALGAAYLAGLAVGYWKGLKQIAAQWQVDRRFTHAMKPAQRKQLETGWRKALDPPRRWEEAGWGSRERSINENKSKRARARGRSLPKCSTTSPMARSA